MRRETIFAVAPFALVAVLAAGVALAGFIASPRARPDLAATQTPSASASAPNVAASPSPAKASPSATASAGTTGPKSNDAGAMLRVHNELRAAIGAGRRLARPVGALLVALAAVHGLFAQLLVISRFYG